jgi:hypothetical protein
MERKASYFPIHHSIRLPLAKVVNLESFTAKREDVTFYLTKLAALVRSHTKLFLLGTISELIYILYLLHSFPLLRYFQNFQTDLGGITGYSQTAFLTFILVFSFLFVTFGLAWWEAHSYQDRVSLWIILSFGSIFSLTTVFVYPITALDLFFYIARSLILVQYHINPMVTPPAQFMHDPLIKQMAILVIHLPSPYGPLAQIVQALPLLIAGRNVLAALLTFKLLFSAIIIISAFFVYKILLQIAPKFALPGALALAWNPFILLEYSANSHNDIVMMLFVILAVFALVKERYAWAMTLITASSLIKFATLVVIPLFFIYSFMQQPTKKTRVTYTIKAMIVFSSVIIDSFVLFWNGPQTLQRSLTQAQGYLYSFSIFIVDFLSGKLTYNQGRLLGWVLFGICFLPALWLSSRGISNLLKGCFITMFTLLAFGSSFLQPWYFVWPFVFALFIPSVSVSLTCFLLVYAATMAELVHAYIFPWSGSQYKNVFVIANSITYLAIFLPPALLLLASRFKLIPTQRPSAFEEGCS